MPVYFYLDPAVLHMNILFALLAAECFVPVSLQPRPRYRRWQKAKGKETGSSKARQNRFMDRILRR